MSAEPPNQLLGLILNHRRPPTYTPRQQMGVLRPGVEEWLQARLGQSRSQAYGEGGLAPLSEVWRPERRVPQPSALTYVGGAAIVGH